MNHDNLIIDCFAGGGGASVGIEMALGRQVDIAVNHDPKAILMHKTNHPDTLHLTEDIFKVDLKKICGGKHVSLMWASPDCTSYSKAKGGQPRKKGLRILPWAVYKHAKTILPDVIIMENVEEIQQWGPLDDSGKPIPERRGEDYQKFIISMKSLGYVFDSRELVAADYGAPTTRKRWYAIFRRDGKEIVWPEATHRKGGANGLKQWKPCGDYIDWSDLGKSIFDRKKPLADATMRRIANGYVKYVVNNQNPYIVKNKEAVAFLIQYHGEQKFGDLRGQLLTEPIKTIDTSNRYGLVTAFITKFYKTGVGQGCDEPLHTITTSPGHFGLISAFLIKYYGTGCGQELSSPLGTITTKDRFGLVNIVTDIDGEKYILKDIFLRMLKPEELKLMQGFPDDYIIERDYKWNPYPIKEQVARIGNSVVPIMAQMLVKANCGFFPENKAGSTPKDYESKRIKKGVEEEMGKEVVYGPVRGFAKRDEAESYILRIFEDIDDIKNKYMGFGFHLAELEKCKYYNDVGYGDFYEFCESNYGLKKSEVSRCINVWRRFSEKEGYVCKMWIDKKYEDYNYSQLTEMLPLSSVEIKYVNPVMSVREIREYKKNCKGKSESEIKKYIASKAESSGESESAAKKRLIVDETETAEENMEENSVKDKTVEKTVQKKFNYIDFSKMRADKCKKYIESVMREDDWQGCIRIIDGNGKVTLIRNARCLDEDNRIFYVPCYQKKTSDIHPVNNS